MAQFKLQTFDHYTKVMHQIVRERTELVRNLLETTDQVLGMCTVCGHVGIADEFKAVIISKEQERKCPVCLAVGDKVVKL